MNYYTSISSCMLFCLLKSGTCHAEELIDINIEEQEDKYILHIEAHIDADVNKVSEIIKDYENLPAINPFLRESKIVHESNEYSEVNMLSEACIFFICYKLRHVQRFKKTDSNTIYAEIIPEQSDFKSGWTKWELKDISNFPNQEKTKILLDAEFVPDFFIMPIIGPYHLKKKIVEISLVTVRNLENKSKDSPVSFD